MWPYTDEEWDTITYGIKKKVKKRSKILLLSAIPSILLIVLLFTII